MNKECAKCGAEFTKRSRESWAQWDARRFCSRLCNSENNKLGDFWGFVDKSGACWIWNGPTDSCGYGMYRNRRAHRVAFESDGLAIPNGMVVCHRCDNPPCVRSDHLFLGSQQDNVIDCMSKRRRRTKVTAEQVRQIRARRAAGEKGCALAEEFGLSQGTISQIVHGKKWASLEKWDAAPGKGRCEIEVFADGSVVRELLGAGGDRRSG